MFRGQLANVDRGGGVTLLESNARVCCDFSGVLIKWRRRWSRVYINGRPTLHVRRLVSAGCMNVSNFSAGLVCFPSKSLLGLLALVLEVTMMPHQSLMNSIRAI